MKIFDWMQSKLTGKPRTNKKPSLTLSDDHDNVQKPPKEEVSEWSHGLLTIGTLGNGDLKEDHLQRFNTLESSNPPPSPKDYNLHDFTPEEARNLQDELDSYLNEQAGQSSCASAELEKVPNCLIPLDKFLNRQSSFKAERDCDESKENFGRFQRSTSMVLSRGNDVCLDNSNSAIGKKSLSFLLKKMFVCRSGFAPAAPGLRDPIPESRMEKIMKAILHKKIYPQSSSSSSTLSKKKYLENRHKPKSAINHEEEITDDEGDEGSKWVKTDSEYIVLEIQIT